MHIYYKYQLNNKKRILLLNLLINCICARSTPQIITLNNEFAFRFSNFLIIGFSSSPADSLFDKILFSKPGLFCVAKVFARAHIAAPIADFSSKKL